ncbi:bifunctional phosphoribosyl-AMP cyclohydrolase/phosphoribosyl-ATP diphosphatase HisIE [Paenibacillus sp. IB182496]|uniref:Histidine biosynthesis bifunctional protein HisIE n=1 Tax=Paenibacillus sabuli TaxID=2772509 RepID=A0A927GTE3_9BACL|nr:bifunctional phosphoribosyl-AMP cyclohydrolase/phosphoribosyl-ATP diphosphatase HisIE [Paenibacillus sabuli]MBD2847488.1 bifunctional phosphoribosyl-AMP cyclohydrolase/phosphoribosyl-ATP diphosphatase HisIE [Paenibacillus sabuli]
MSEASWQDAIKWDENGLVPAVVQDVLSKEVLMLAYMNRESLAQSLASGQTWFWSRSRGELWHKGATSGHTQTIRSLRYDCDGDTLLVQVEQRGAACHTGSYSCFYRSIDLPGTDKAEAAAGEPQERPEERFAVLGELETAIAQRDAERPEGTYTSYLFDKGVDKILKKIGEESAEVIIAAKNEDPDELRSESADLIYHLLVLLRERKLPLDDVLRELGTRRNKPTTNKMR